MLNTFIVCIRFTARVLAVALIGLGCLVQLLVVLLTTIVQLTDTASSPALCPLEDTVDEDEIERTELYAGTVTQQPTTCNVLPITDSADTTVVLRTDYTALTWSELRALAKQCGITVRKKVDILEALTISCI